MLAKDKHCPNCKRHNILCIHEEENGCKVLRTYLCPDCMEEW